MFNVTLDRLSTFLEPLGVELPDDAKTIIALRAEALSAATATPIDDLRADVAAGKVKPADVRKRITAAATELTIQEKSRALIRELEPTLDNLARRWARDHGDELIATLRPQFDDAAATLTATVKELGAHADPAAVLERGKDAAEAWTRGRDALAVLHQIRAVRRELNKCG